MKIKLTHPGKILLQEFMEPLNISAYKLAKDIDVPITRITNIIRGKRSISPETALLLAKYFNMSERFFINLQSYYDLELAKENLNKSKKLNFSPFAIENFITA
jgi:addiction module HigA family antidote